MKTDPNRHHPRPGPRKVFGIGMFRTGTSTLGRCLETLGYRHTTFWNVADYNRPNPRERILSRLDEILERARQYDAFEDAPWLFLFREMHAAYPGSKFILTVRKDADSLVQSELRWHAMNAHNQSEIPDASHFRDRYESHNAAVREFFACHPGQLLEICWEDGDGWEQLCPFLEQDIPRGRDGRALPIPRLNRSNFPRKFRLLAGKLKRAILNR